MNKKNISIQFLFVIFIIFFLASAFSQSDNLDKEGRTFKRENLFNGVSLDGWEICNFGAQGPVQVADSSIYLVMGEGCTGIRWKGTVPQKDYDISLEAKRVNGHDFFCGLTFPVNDSFCSLIIGGWGGSVVGLSSIDELDASENETALLKKFELNKWYKIRLQVREETIKAWIDDEKVVDVIIKDRTLSIRPEVILSKPFGITSWYTTAALRNIQLRSIE